jgi:phenylacetate-coenzyme A ligase PaaK-like adenylate-forming protein
MILEDELFSVNDLTFEAEAIRVFNHQYVNTGVYRMFCDSLGLSPKNVNSISDIPFLPVEFFKTHRVLATGKSAQVIFESSGTTGSVPSRHYVSDLGLYEGSFIKSFGKFYGEPSEYVILGLLPSYLERNNSSLVYMTHKLIEYSGNAKSGFFLNEFEKLSGLLAELKRTKQKTMLLGVTFALLDFAEKYKIDFPELIVMETGGMKGRREELTRAEVHEKLCPAFGVEKIHSEYGMTELLSQGYSKGDGIFDLPPWMKIYTRDVYDPLKLQETGTAGGVNIIDLANLNSCSFIATNDLGIVNEDGTFEIMGRMDNAEIRGCNLMVM